VVPTVGVQFLPGFKNESTRTEAEQAVLDAAAGMTVDVNGIGWTRKQLHVLLKAISLWRRGLK
jgi:hypothetical protein